MEFDACALLVMVVAVYTLLSYKRSQYGKVYKEAGVC